jgi:transposase
MKVVLHYDLRRVDCRYCGIRAELVPWAEPGSRFTRDFEEQVAYLAQRCDQSTVAKTMRMSWSTVGDVVQRVVARVRTEDLLDNLTLIGIDELSYRRHHEYVTVVVDHVRQRVVWAAPGKNAATLDAFFDALGPKRTAELRGVTIDMSAAYTQSVSHRAPRATLIYDRFHVQRLVQDALDEVRRAQMRVLDGADRSAIKNTRYSLLKNYWNLSTVDVERLAKVQQTNRPLYRAYLLKAIFAEILGRSDERQVRQKLEEWISWARRSRLPSFKRVAATIRKHLEGIIAIVTTGLSNGRTEALNGKIRTITRRAFGFHRVSNLVSYIMLCCTGLVLSPVFKFTPLHPQEL